MNIDPQTLLELSGNELIITGSVTNDQLVSLQALPDSHILIKSVVLEAIRLNADEAVELVRSSLNAPDSVIFGAAGDLMAVSGTASAEWYSTAIEADFYSGGWALDFEPLKDNLSVRMGELTGQLNSSVFQFLDGIRLNKESQDRLEQTALTLVELQSLSLALGNSVSIILEGLGDGIDTQEKNLEIARKRTDRVLSDLVNFGVDPARISHTMGEWEEGGLNLERRRVTLLIQAGSTQ